TLVRCKAACREPARTLDGELINVEANIGIHDDVELALDNGADGVGLLRIEQLYFARPVPPTEDELFSELESLITPLGQRPVTDPPAFGAMVETPAAALAIPALWKHVDFFCVGTNDLTQYTLAAARDDASVNDYYLDSHESVLRLLRIILADAGERPVTLCGELAGREAYVSPLLSMGFRALSVAPTVIPTTKALIRQLNLSAATG